MSIELKQVVEQPLDLSTPTLREMVTRHAAVIDSRATLEDIPEALAFQIDMARALLREFAAIQQAEAQQPATPDLRIGVCITDGVLHATVMQHESNGAITVVATAEIDAASLHGRDCIGRMKPATGEPVGVNQLRKELSDANDFIQSLADLCVKYETLLGYRKTKAPEGASELAEARGESNVNT